MLVTAASELARNTLIHGGGGRFSWEVISAGPRRGVRLSFEDDGPGIPDIQSAMTNGWTSGNGLGLGLPGAKRLVNEFEVQSTVGRGTASSLFSGLRFLFRCFHIRLGVLVIGVGPELRANIEDAPTLRTIRSACSPAGGPPGSRYPGSECVA